ncbi:MAG TPA: homoserine O-succinyltransferase [Stellaceae bacterium]|nr:homoserine O-succinyltransferase [Stellaceae bacterium]
MARFSPDPLSRKTATTTGAGPITIGLVNNMPDAALKFTELQVRDLLRRAAGRREVSLRTFSLPGVPRSAEGRRYVAQHHEPIDQLWDGHFDGLIVTGTEPRAERIEDEPYWPALAQLIDWADNHTISSVWSCLAAHAAVYRLDGIVRSPFDSKLFGVFDCTKIADHPLVAAGPGVWQVPHSRCNELPEQVLAANGYRILSRSDAAGADLFIKQKQSLYVFLQGHPEYDATALFGEYRRDVRRYLSGEMEHYPELPHGYFTDGATEALLAFREWARERRDIALLEQFPAAAVGRELTAPWRDAATRLYSNWLGHLARNRARRRGLAGPEVPPAGHAASLTYA